MHKIAFGWMLTIGALALSACATPFAGNIPMATPAHAFRFGVPVESEADARIATQSALRASFDYAEPLTVVSAERTTYGENVKRFGVGSDRPTDMKIWLVIYFDKGWQVHPPGPTATAVPPFSGCVRVVIDARDATPVEVGGPVPKGLIAGCDR